MPGLTKETFKIMEEVKLSQRNAITNEEIQQFYDEMQEEENRPEPLEPELSRQECEELMAQMDKYEERAKEEMASWVKVYSCKDYPQEFLKSLIPKR